MGHLEITDPDEILQQKFTSKFRSGYTERANITMPKRYEDLKDDIATLKFTMMMFGFVVFQKQASYLVGTTWTQEMVWLLGNDLDYKAAEENLGARFPFLEVSCVFDFRDLKNNNLDFEPPIFLEDSIKFVKASKRPRFIKTHLPWALLPKQITDFKRKPKIICVYRNPKDTFVSYFHHARLFEGFTGNFEEFYKLFIAGKVIFGPFWENVLGYWKQSGQDILFLRYEEMKRDLEGAILKTANYLNRELTDDQLQKLLKHLSFEEMKQNRAVNFEPVLDFFRKFKLVQVDGLFMRTGKEKSHKEEINLEKSEELDAWSLEKLDGTNFELQF